MELDRFGWPSGPTLNVQSLPTDFQEPPQQELDAVLDGLHEYQRRLFANRRHGVLLVVQGLDAAGKDSLIRTLARAMDPAAFRVHAFSRPLGEEVDHDFLWRVWRHLPARGKWWPSIAAITNPCWPNGCGRSPSTAVMTGR